MTIRIRTKKQIAKKIRDERREIAKRKLKNGELLTFADLPYQTISRKVKIYCAVEVKYGTKLPKGFLPAYSVDTEEEARLLIAATCKLNLTGQYISPDMIDSFTGETWYGKRGRHGFVRFAYRLIAAHARIKRSKK